MDCCCDWEFAGLIMELDHLSKIDMLIVVIVIIIVVLVLCDMFKHPGGR